MIVPGRIPVYPSLQDTINEINFADNVVHNDMAHLFTRSNLLYNMSSSSEDIITARFMSLYGMAKSVMNGNFNNANYVVENFNSQDYLDEKFPVDNTLNIDTQNGVLSLPITGMEDLKIEAIILESDSNGQPGNSLSNFINADINAINSSSSSSLFEYEKVVNTFTATELYLAMTLKLDSIQICNGIYLKLFADEGTRYPIIDLIETSHEGTRWLPVEYSVEAVSDYFIKFDPRRIRFLRIRFKQDSYKYTVTPFGTKYRYMIGVRQVVLKKIKYGSAGEYVSIPFSSKGSISNVSTVWDDKSLGDIKYSLSANNGGKWIEITNSDVLEIINQDAGLRGDIEIDTVRLKIEMNRTASPNSASATEYMMCNSENSYFLKNLPVSISASLGYHISRGDIQPYEISLQGISSINKDVLFDAPQCIAGSRFKIPLMYVPFYEADPFVVGSRGIVDDLVVKINGVSLLDDQSVWTVSRHPNPAHSILILDIDKLPEKLQGDVLQNSSSVSGTIGVTFKPYVHDHRWNDKSLITLPTASLVDTVDGFTVQMVNLIPEALEQKAFAYDQEVVGGHEPLYGVDNDSATYWSAASKDKNGIWTFEFLSQDYITLESYMISPFIYEDNSGKKSLEYNPRVWELQAKPENADVWLTVDSQSLAGNSWSANVGKEFKVEMDCKFRRFRLKILESFENTSSLEEQQKIGFTNISMFSRSTKSLVGGSDFIVIDRKHIQILPVAYNTKADYEVTYFPAADVTPFMTQPVLTNRIEMNGLHKAPPNAKVCFQYKYQDLGSLEDIKYYTPFCNEYRMTFV